MMRLLLCLFGLVCSMAPTLAFAEEWAPCRTDGYLSHFDVRLTAQPCDVVTTVNVPYRSFTIRLRAIHRRSSPMSGDPAFTASMNAAAAAIGEAMNRMGPGLRLGDVTVLYTNMLSASSAEGRDQFLRGEIQAWTSALAPRTDYSRPGGPRECPITYYKGVSRSSDAWLRFVLAHEVFHCIQFNSWPGMPRDKWLIEGSAEYFGYLAQPGGDGEGDRYIGQFDSRIPGTPLLGMDYDAVAFFLWYSNVYNPPGVHGFVRDTHSLAAAVTPDMWMKFAQAYQDRQVKFPDGRPIPSHPAGGRIKTIGATDEFTKPSNPFTINSYTFVFPRGKAYRLTYSETPEDGREAWRKFDGADWAAPPPNVTSCDGEKRYRVLWTTTRSSAAGRTRVSSEPASAGACTCPAGTWQETTASTRHFVEQSAFGSRDRHYLSGNRVLQLNPDHTGSFTYNNVEIQVGKPGDEVWLHQVQTGGTHFTWKIVNGMLLTVYTRGVNLVTLHNEMNTRSRVISETRQAGAQSIGHFFHCDQTGLHLTQNTHVPSYLPGAPAFSVNLDFARLGDER